MNSFYIGIYKNFRIIPILKYGVGLEYLQNGAESTVDGSYSLGYVSIPIHIRAKLGPVFALVGVAANFKVTEAKSGVFEPDRERHKIH